MIEGTFKLSSARHGSLAQARANRLFHPKRKLSRPSETQGTADVIDVEGVVRKPLQLLDLLTSVRIQALYPAL
jgi:hypothetical protein